MNLIDRYIFAVQQYAPAAQQQSVADDLREHLENEVDALSDGQPTEHEIAGLLQRFGSPEQVAQRYAPRPQPVKPEQMPKYMLVLRYVIAVAFGLTLIKSYFSVIASESFHFSQFISQFIFRFIDLGLFGFAVVTLIFWAINTRPQPEDKWDPHSLPEAGRPWQRIRLSDIVSDIAEGIFILLLLWYNVWGPEVLSSYNATMMIAPGLADWRIALTALVAVAIAKQLWLLRKPYWTARLLSINLLMSAIYVVVFGYLASLSEFIIFGSETTLMLSPEWINQLIRGLMALVAVIYLVKMVRDGRRLRQLRQQQ
ncbi:hypothetical protein IDSA_05130 [Pseudidiomarina salinarum]|uniref:Uncharacterized protein n=1 Tax=Pseudidiomarina salinarum TaxID=435908 RepID=A0A094IY71_9GAMM|nr:hypothetical protein [Pseudidiomarina salinarum]KFZ32057.1 hypothetical protein IDSA_05130 [Pseudidiomarina salinarum]RUO70163.1 hypothetical protein CWI79_01455 [Pseudidiomarina salinarum]